MSKSINIVPIKMNKINRVKATVRPQNVRKEKIEEEEIDYSKGLDSKQTLTKYENIIKNTQSKVSRKVETKTNKVEGIQNLFGGIKEKAHDMYKSTGAKVTGIKDAVASGAKKVAETGAKVGASAINVGLSATKGILNLGEGLVDGAQIVSKVSETPFLAMADAVNYVGCKVTNQEYKSILKSSWEQTRERVAYKAVDTLYDKIYDTKIGKAIDEASYLKREGTACKIVEGVSTTLGIIAASIFTGGAAAGGAVSAAASSAGTAATFAAIKGVGEGSEEAFQNKEVSTARGVLYGVANGAYEGLQYYLGAKIGNAMPVKEGAKISAGLAKGLNSLFHIGFDAVDGGTEGGIRPLLKKIYEDKSYDELFQENGGWSAVLTNAAIGGSVSAIGEGIDAVGVNKILENLNSKYQENYHYRYSDLNKYQKKIAKDWDSYGSISPEVGKKLEDIFFEDGYVVGVHRTGTANILENGHASLADKIMDEGLKLTGHGGQGFMVDEPDLELNISFTDGKRDWDYANFLRNVKSASSYKTFNDVGSAMIIKIPKDLLDQTDVITKKMGDELVLDPKYIVGYVNADHGNLGNFINNQIKINDVGTIKFNTIDDVLKEYNHLVDSDVRLKDIMSRRANGEKVVVPKDLESSFEKLVSLDSQIQRFIPQDTNFKNALDVESFYDQFPKSRIGANQGFLRMVSQLDESHPLLQKYVSIVQDNFPGLSEKDAIRLLKESDSKVTRGICTYATATNTIMDYFKRNEDLFQKVYGESLYRMSSDGTTKLLNDDYVLADFYCWVNKNTLVQNVDGTAKYVTNQVRSIDLADEEVVGDLFQSYLKSKGIDVHSELNPIFNNTPILTHQYAANMPKEHFNDYIVNEVESSLKDGTVELGVMPKADGTSKAILLPLRDASGDKIDVVSGSHSMTVIGIQDENHLIVSSWGNKYYVDINDLKSDAATYSLSQIKLTSK